MFSLTFKGSFCCCCCSCSAFVHRNLIFNKNITQYASLMCNLSKLIWFMAQVAAARTTTTTTTCAQLSKQTKNNSGSNNNKMKTCAPSQLRARFRSVHPPSFPLFPHTSRLAGLCPHSRATNRPWRWTLKHNKLKFSPTKIAMLTSSVPVCKHQKKRQRERERKWESKTGRREKSEKQAFANCRTRRTTWRTRVFRARSSFGPRTPPLHPQPYPQPHPGPGSGSGPGPGLRHMILPNLICRSGPRALIMWLLAICHSCWTASKEVSRASRRAGSTEPEMAENQWALNSIYIFEFDWN